MNILSIYFYSIIICLTFYSCLLNVYVVEEKLKDFLLSLNDKYSLTHIIVLISIVPLANIIFIFLILLVIILTYFGKV